MTIGCFFSEERIRKRKDLAIDGESEASAVSKSSDINLSSDKHVSVGGNTLLVRETDGARSLQDELGKTATLGNTSETNSGITLLESLVPGQLSSNIELRISVEVSESGRHLTSGRGRSRSGNDRFGVLPLDIGGNTVAKSSVLGAEGTFNTQSPLILGEHSAENHIRGGNRERRKGELGRDGSVLVDVVSTSGHLLRGDDSGVDLTADEFQVDVSLEARGQEVTGNDLHVLDTSGGKGTLQIGLVSQREGRLNQTGESSIGVQVERGVNGLEGRRET